MHRQLPQVGFHIFKGSVFFPPQGAMDQFSHVVSCLPIGTGALFLVCKAGWCSLPHSYKEWR